MASIDEVNDIDPIDQYTASTSQTEFDYSFPITSEEDLVVYDNDTLQVLATDYTVTGEGDDNGGSITFLVGRTAGHTITLYRDIAIERITDFQQNGPLASAVVNDELDKITLIAQQLESRIGRSLRLSLRNPQASSELEIGAPFNDKYLYINADGELVPALLSAQTLTQSDIGSLLYPVEGAEDAAGVTPINLEYPPGNVLRYGTNAIPGTTDMTAAVQAALDVANNGIGEAVAPGGTYLIGTINWPGNNLTLRGAGTGYAYNTSAVPKTIFKAKSGTNIVFDLVQTGEAEDRTVNRLLNFKVDGDGIAAAGINCAASNIIEGVNVVGCTTAGCLLSTLTNSTHIVRCGFNSNSGWGLKVEGASSTVFSVDETNTSLNTLGGIDIEGGVLAKFSKVVSESNAGPGLRIYRPSAHTNVLGSLEFDMCWFEDNGSATPFFTLEIDAQTRNETNAPARILFHRCRINPSVATRKYMAISCAKWVTFDECQFDASTASDAVTLGSEARIVAFLESVMTSVSGITATQMDNALAQGARCYSSDRDIRRVVGAGAPAAAFQNSWVNFDAATHSTAKYWFDREGNVCIEGSVKTGAAPSTVFTLPVGYRPLRQKVFAVDANGTHGTVYVNTNGTVQIIVGSSTITSLDGIKFETG